MKIHIVDAEPDMLESCQFLVRQLGYKNIILWEDGLDFIQGTDLHEPAIAILDLRMPRMDGQQVIAHLCENNSAIAPVIVAGQGELALTIDLFKSGVVEFLEKPVAMMPLEEAILLAQKTLQERNQING